MTALLVTLFLLTVWWAILLYVVMTGVGVESIAEWIGKRLWRPGGWGVNFLLLLFLWPIMLSRSPTLLLLIAFSAVAIDYFLIR